MPLTLGSPTAAAVGPSPGAGVDVAVLEAALARPVGRLRFEPELETAYQRDTAVSRITRIAACNVLGAASYFVLSAGTAAQVDALEPLMGALRQGTIAFIAVAAAVCLLLRRSIAPWRVETLTSIGSLLVAAYTVHAAHHPPDLSALIQTGALFTVFLHSGLAARQDFRFALGAGLLGFGAYVLGARSHDEAQALVVRGNILLMATTLAFALLANYVLEHRDRRAYLLQSLEAHRLRALQATTEALQRLAHSDALTGLANRRLLDTALQAAWRAAAAAGEPLAVLQIDVDFFKRYNDHYGHPAGDLCLQRVAGVLAAVANRAGGLAARTGGEEFALLLPRCDAEAAAGLGEHVVAAVQALGLAHAGSAAAPVVTVSVGTASALPRDAPQPTDLLRAGDEALYEAKRGGRNRVVCGTGLAHLASTAVADEPPAEPPEPPEPPSALVQRIETLAAVLRHGLRRLRFPAELEAAWRAHVAPARQQQLPVLGLGGLLMLLGYNWLSRPLLGGVAELTMNVSLLLSAAVLPLLAWCRRPMGYLQRETIFSIAPVIVSTGVVSALSFGDSRLIYSFILSLFLVPMFCAVIASQPFRHSLATSAVVVGFAMIVLHPDRADWTAVWAETMMLVVTGAFYSLIGGYLIEYSMRRQYLLKQIAQAQHLLITENAERLRRLADADPLTGLANRRRFDALHVALTQTCAAEGRRLGLLIIDIDHFKRYNDSHTHIAGDACLKRVAHALCEPVSQAELPSERCRLARIGGEEFALLLPGADADQALALASVLCDRVRRLAIPHADSPLGPSVTISIGAASVLPAPGGEPGLLLKRADLALYRAKANGRDCASV